MSLRRAPGEGCVHQRQDGRWQGSLQVDGIRRTVYGKTRQQVLSKLADLRKQAAANGALPDSGRRTLGELLDAWLEAVRPNLKPSTAREHYELLANTYLRPALAVLPGQADPIVSRFTWASCGTGPVWPKLTYHVLASLRAGGALALAGREPL